MDASWQTLDLPHDYSIHQDFSQSGEAEVASCLVASGGTAESPAV